ncbi:MAG: OmpH family outer membrane protein [Paludibacteraceae bacterium]|nr:OmpH family outer membrane protein [Paludibacteraceae bacterium]
MFKKITLILMVALLPLFATAQTVKLGYINSQEVMMMMPEVNDVEKQLADFNEKNMKYLQDMEKEIQDKYAKYEQEKDNMTEAIRKVQEEELMGLQQRLQTTYQALQQEAQKKQVELLKPLQDKLMAAIESVSKKQGLTMVYDMMSGAVVYKSEAAIDITPAVKKELGIL